MLKKFFNRLKKNPDKKVDKEENENTNTSENKVDEICITEEIVEQEEMTPEYETIDLNIENKLAVDESYELINNEEVNTEDEQKVVYEEISIKENEQEDEEYIKAIKIKRGKSIRAIDVYTEEEIIFKTHKECSRKIKVPIDYIVENLKYGYTDYLGDAINYLSKELQSSDDCNYLESNKTPIEIFNNLHNKIFSNRISEKRRDEILLSERIEPIKMHYKFECLDAEYDEYFEKYKSIIKRGGKKKIELVDKKGEAIEIFKSLDECANFLGKEKYEVVDMLKYMDNKVGRNEIRYSLRNI